MQDPVENSYISLFYILGVIPSESDSSHLSIIYTMIPRYIAIYNDYKFVAYPYCYRRNLQMMMRWLKFTLRGSLEEL